MSFHSLSRASLAIGIVAASTVLGGCGGAPEDAANVDSANGEKTAETSAALTADYSWSQEQGHATLMWSVNDGYCALTGMSGNFQGTGEGVEVTVWGNTWVINGWSQQFGVGARARCISWSDLTNSGGYGFQTWSATDYGPRNGAEPFEVPVEMWNGYNFCSLSRLTGNMYRGGEWAQNWYDGANWWLEASSGVINNEVDTSARCVGLKLNHPIAFTAPVHLTTPDNGTTGYAYLGSASNLFCGLSEIQGAFRGGGEHVEILNFSGSYYLSGSSWTSGGQTGASATCVYLHQHN